MEGLRAWPCLFACWSRKRRIFHHVLAWLGQTAAEHFCLTRSCAQGSRSGTPWKSACLLCACVWRGQVQVVEGAWSQLVHCTGHEVVDIQGLDLGQAKDKLTMGRSMR